MPGEELEDALPPGSDRKPDLGDWSDVDRAEPMDEEPQVVERMDEQPT